MDKVVSLTPIQQIKLRNFFYIANAKVKAKLAKAARVIQRAFRLYLFRKQNHFYTETRTAIKIQRAWRNILEKAKSPEEVKKRKILFQIGITKLEHKYPPIPHSKTRQTIIPELPPPWGNQNKNKFTNERVEEMLKEREQNYKYFFNLVSNVPRTVFNKIDTIKQIKEKNAQYMNRIVPASFYLFSYFFSSQVYNLKYFFFHEPTFTLYALTSECLISFAIGNANIERKETFLNTKERILDATMDPRSGRIYILCNNWRIIVYEHGHLLAPRAIHTKRASSFQEKYIYCDKFGYLWLFKGGSKPKYFILDPLSFVPLSSKDIRMPEHRTFDHLIPLTRNRNPSGFLVFDSNKHSIFTASKNAIIGDDISMHDTRRNEAYLTKDLLVTYGKDCKMCIYNRVKDNFELKQTVMLEAPCTAVQYLKRMNAFIVALENAKLLLLSYQKDGIQGVIPKSYLEEKMQRYYEDALGDEIKPASKSKEYVIITQKRMRTPAHFLRAIQFSTVCTMIICGSNTGEIDIIQMVTFEYRIKAFQVGLIDIPPLFTSPKVVCNRFFTEDFSQIINLIQRTRNQFARDARYLSQIGPEVEKRFILGRLKSNDTLNFAEIMLQCPYRRWFAFLGYAKNELTIYELFYLVFGYNIALPSLNTPEKLSNFITDNLNKKNVQRAGIYECISTLTFTKDEITTSLMLVSDLFKSQLDEFRVFRDGTRNFELKLQSLYFKSQINDFNSYALHRFTEIENMVKNRIRMQQLNIQFSTKKITKRVPIPEIYPEPFLPVFNRKLIQKPKGLCPDPLFEAFRYKTHRDINLKSHEIEYCSYNDEAKTVEIIPAEDLATAEEVALTRSLAYLNFGQKIIGVEKETSKIMQNYPSGHVPLSYVLEANPFKSGSPQSFLVARYWLLQMLVIIGTLHGTKTVLRSCLPSNFLVSPDGSTITLLSVSDAYIPGNKTPPLHWANTFEHFLPPEYFDTDKPTPAFDVFQFGVLLLWVFTDFSPPSFAQTLKEHQKYRKNDALAIAKSHTFYYDPLDGIDLSKFPHFTASGEKLQSILEIDSNYSLLDITVACLDLDPERRPTVRQLLDSPFFNLTASLCGRAKTISQSILYNIPLSIFVNGVFGTLCSSIEDELHLDPSNAPTLVTAVQILDEFLNPGRTDIHFPIDTNSTSKVVNEVFEQHFFDQIVSYVINCLSKRFELGDDVKEDDAFTSLISLYYQFFRTCLNQPTIFSRTFPSFKRLSTGINMWRESFKLFTFLYTNIKPLVEFFFLKVPPESHKLMGISEFYCENFVHFYDNMRDFAMAFEEKSFRRHAAALQFMKTFIEAYPTNDTKQLLYDFGVAHKVEQALAFAAPSVRISALELAAQMLRLNDPNLFGDFIFHFFPYHLLSNTQPYPEKKALVELTGSFLLSHDFNSIISLLRAGIFESLIYCTSSTHQEYNQYFVWGYKEDPPVYKVARSVLKEICNNGISLILSFIYCNEDMSYELTRLKCLSPMTKSFDEMIDNLSKNIVDPTLVSTMSIAECSSISTIASITSQTSQAFQNSMNCLAVYLLRSEIENLSLYKSLLLIWEAHDWPVYIPLFEYVAKTFERGRTDIVLLPLQIKQRKPLPDCMLTVVHSFVRICREKYEEIQSIVKRRDVDMNFVDRYARERKWRIDMLKAILQSRDRRLIHNLESEEHFVDFIVSCLMTPVKLEVNLRIVPPSFANFNRTYQIRNEAITFVKLIAKHKFTGDIVFAHFANEIRFGGLLVKEAELLRRIRDPTYRKTCIRLLGILSDTEDEFHFNEIIVNSDILMELKDETLYDWENFQILRNAWGKRLDSGKGIYGRVHCLYDCIK